MRAGRGQVRRGLSLPRLITSAANPLAKAARELREKRGRREQGRFLAEGLRICTEAREAGRLPDELWFAEGGDHVLLQALIHETEAAGGAAVATSPALLAKLSGKDNPQAVLGIFKEWPTGLDRIDRSAAPIWLVAERLRDPGNLGTILRTADAVGAGGLILLDDSADPFSVEAVRASMGAIFTVPLARAAWAEFLPWLRAGAGQLVGLSLDTDIDYRAAAYTSPTFLLTGNESQGLPPAYAAACDLRVRIPMRGKADSLNAAVATAVMAYEVARGM